CDIGMEICDVRPLDAGGMNPEEDDGTAPWPAQAANANAAIAAPALTEIADKRMGFTLNLTRDSTNR
ncbi:MAG TPA: hypothetical protein VEW74_05120, partial [Candidatus Nitrosotalea sp.]|nr:hypothetical protein [Candidatus Nitrosotalea sp.]